MTFKKKGFLSSDMDYFRTVLRTVPEYQLWFAFAEDLVRLGLDMLNGLETPRDDPQRLAMSPLFVRTHQSFQAAILLRKEA
jgi:hypothetical protein